MREISIRDLRYKGGEVVDRVAQGESVTVTRSGKAVAELRPLRKQTVSVEALIARRKTLPLVDPVALRSVIDAAVNTEL